jgi:endonuclease/exonuclease/phosphatase family metal-dependent hydrolase
VNVAGRSFLFIITVCVVACSDSTLLEPAAPEGAASASSSLDFEAGALTVMTRNMYIGNDVDLIIAALASPDPNDDIPVFLAGVETFQKTDFPARAEAMADEILRTRPHVVGLQEVDHVLIDLRGFGIPLNIDMDFLPILLAALSARGLNYAVAAQVTNFDASPLPGVRVTDHDALLVDASRVSVGPTVTARTYTTNRPPAGPVTLIRGFVAIDVSVTGLPMIKVANTHLESGPGADLANIRVAQARELMEFIGRASPAVVLGDLNDGPESGMHRTVTRAGFIDIWAALSPEERGFTCCQVADLSNQTSILNQRIDYVFARGFHPHKKLSTVNLVGDRLSDRIPGPAYLIWPSDHAGVVASLPSKNKGEEQEGDLVLARSALSP